MICSICNQGAHHECLHCLDAPIPCETHIIADVPQQCKRPAHWRVNGVAECDECILSCVERMPNNAEWLAPALREIRHQIVIILIGEEQGKSGCVYAHLPGIEHEWHVRPFGWPAYVPGIAYANSEVEPATLPIFLDYLSYPEIPQGWGIEARGHDEFYAYSLDGFSTQYISDERGLDKIFVSYETALKATQDACIADVHAVFLMESI